MEIPRATLWTTRKAEKWVGLLECDLPPRVRRRVHVAVDTTDSCTQPGPPLKTDPVVDALLGGLAQILEPGDTCSLWLLGGDRPAAHVEVLPGMAASGETVGRLRRGLRFVRGGTWLCPTLRGMISAAADARVQGMAPYLIVATDGEVFDAEDVPRVLDTVVDRSRLLGRDVLEGRNLGVVRLGPVASAVAALPLLSRVDVVEPSAESLRSFLRLDEPRFRVAVLGWCGTARPFNERLLEGPWEEIRPGANRVQVVFVGDSPAQPVIVQDGGERPPWGLPEVRSIGPEPPQRLQKILDDLGVFCWRWDREQLRGLVQVLAAAAEGERVVRCLRCPTQPAYQLRHVRGSLYCRVCSNLLLAKGPVTEMQLRCHGFPRVWRWPVDEQGNPGEARERSSGSGNYACQLLEGDGTRWLEVHLAGARVYK